MKNRLLTLRRIQTSARFIIAFGLTIPLFSQEPFQHLREDMVKYQIEDRGVTSKSVLDAMRKVPRHEFVPGKYLADAHNDHPVPIGYGQTISQPYIVALMTELADVQKGEKVLEIGTGSGYQAAILSEITDSVYTIEIITELTNEAKERLRRLGYNKIVVKNADGYYGWKEYAPFDAIIVTAAAEHIPPPLIEQLKEGGKMIIPVGHPFHVQNLMMVEKQAGKIRSKNILPVRFVPLVRGK
ncbi:MAG: protein-L-isoaspartate(D-aspartate) O-methyltransferase [Ignavibacteriae bacterium]|nr:protein-L-isoaspartate(D-aspartate) O-methyltransferase [Ignavibacteriota bacterium]